MRSAHGAIWGLVHFAGSTSNGMSWKLSLEEFNRVIHANLTSTFLTCREFIPGMREANGGRIITISSIVAFSGIAGAAHYSASKAGVVGLTKSLALELASKKITVNALALGYFNHGMIHTVPENLRAQIRTRIPTDRFGEADEIGGMLKYLLSADGAFLTGQTLHINGGQYV